MGQQLEQALRVLGVPADSDPEQVAEAYRRLARATHPDVSADPDAAARFAALASAYQLASAAARSARTADRDQGSGRPGTAPPGHAARAHRASFTGGDPLGDPPPPRRAGADRPPIVAGPVFVRPLERDRER